MLDDKQRESLKKYYKNLMYYGNLRRQGKNCWVGYYDTLKKIKYLLRYGRYDDE